MEKEINKSSYSTKALDLPITVFAATDSGCLRGISPQNSSPHPTPHFLDIAGREALYAEAHAMDGACYRPAFRLIEQVEE